jgi:hypothetical protein
MRNFDLDRAAEKSPSPVQRKKYTSPRLTEFGHIGTLTKGGAPSTNSDSGNNSMRP